MKNNILKLIFSFALLILLTPVSFAKNTNAPIVKPEAYFNDVGANKEKMEDKKEEMLEKKEEKMEQRCEGIESRIANKIARFQTNKQSHVDKYNELKDKLEEITTSLKEKGFDTADIEEHLAILDGMIIDYAQTYVDFIALLESSEENACGESQGAFKEDMQAARDMFKTILEKRHAIRKYYVDVIRVDIKGIREQAKEMHQEQLRNRDGSVDSLESEEE